MAVSTRTVALLVVLLPLLPLAGGCVTVAREEGSIQPILADPRYDALFPYYLELCAVTQIRSNFAPHGGTPGHAAMYVKGACRDDSTEFPTLKVCGPEVDLRDPESGHGVSVNKLLRNVNWIACHACIHHRPNIRSPRLTWIGLPHCLGTTAARIIWTSKRPAKYWMMIISGWKNRSGVLSNTWQSAN